MSVELVAISLDVGGVTRILLEEVSTDLLTEND